VSPYTTLESSFGHQFGIGVWYGILYSQLVGPFIIESHLTGNICDFCKTKFRHFWTVYLWKHDSYVLKEDGVPPHFSHTVNTYLSDLFPGQWIGSGGAHNWPCRCLNLNHLDLYLWRCMK
jgi:hypothetical protein